MTQSWRSEMSSHWNSSQREQNSYERISDNVQSEEHFFNEWWANTRMS